MEKIEIDSKVLTKLIDRLDTYPIGLPDSKEIRELLSIFLTPDEITLASNFPLMEITTKELAKKVGWSEEKTEKTLEGMADKGTVVDYVLSEDNKFWILTPSMVGFIEFSLMKLRDGYPMEHMARLIEAYEDNHMYKEVFGSKTQMVRALVEVDVPIISEVKTLYEVEEIIRKAGGGTVQTCFCRQKKELLGDTCKVASHLETCFTIGRTASSFIERRGFGRRVDADEMISIVRELSKQGLIHITDNIRHKPSFICNCCGCCCSALHGITKKKIPHAIAPTGFILIVDEEKCNGCGACTKKCQIQALELVDEKAKLDHINCLGCGSCIKFCKQDALSLVQRENPPKIPKNMKDKFIKISWEKGKLLKFLWGILKSKSKLFSKLD